MDPFIDTFLLRYYFYEFTENSTNRSNFKTVILEVDSSNEICMTVSIQNATVSRLMWKVM